MKGNIRRIYSVFDGNSKQLVIPVYQRNYDWGESQCVRLFDDLVDVIRHGRETHFFGAVVGNPEDSFTYVIIDGQQRLTTTSLLMLALVNSLESGILASEKDPNLGRKIRSNYLELTDQDQDAKFKLKPVKNDNEAYRRVLRGDEHLMEDSNVTANYRYFMERIARKELTGDELWRAIQNLEVMVLDLEKDDDPQRIFESLNSTGLELSEADKIRNIVLMGLPTRQQERLYEDFWNRIEQNVGYHTDTFIRQFLISRTRRTPRSDRLYESFREYQAASAQSVEEILSDMRRYSIYLKQLDTATTGHAIVDRRLQRFNLMRRDVALPFFMPVMGDVDAGVLTPAQLAEVVTVIDVYLFRRFVCEVPTNGLNKIFATLYGDVRKLIRGDDSFVDVLIYLVTRRDTGAGRFPGDATFREAFCTRNFYKIPPPTRAYTFECLENGTSNDTHAIAAGLNGQALSVEHIMPQTLTRAWRADLGDDADDIHATWLNRIGNLTISGYNSAYSNSSFHEKKSHKDGYDATPYRLNNDVRSVSQWGPDQIRYRGEQLADKAVEYWEAPTTTFVPAAEPLPEEPMGDEGSFTNRTIHAFELGGVRRTVGSWSDMMLQVVKVLLADHREQIFTLAPTLSGLHAGPKPPKYFSEVVPGLHVNTHATTDNRVAILRRLFGELGLDPEDLTFLLNTRAFPKPQEEVEPVGPYIELTKYIEPLRELSGTSSSSDDTRTIREELLQSFGPFLDDAYAEVLGGKRPPEIVAPEFIANADPKAVIAVVSCLVKLDPVYPEDMHKFIIDGTIVRLLERLG